MRKTTTLLLLLLAMTLVGCGGTGPETGIEPDKTGAEETREATIGLKGGIFGFYPNITNYESSTMSVNSNIYEGLVTFDGEYSIEPQLATTWKNPDDKTWRFTLRKNVTFHCDDTLDAEDVKFSLEHLLRDEDNVMHESVTNIERVEVVDDHTIDIITKESTPILMNKLVDAYIISKEAHEDEECRHVGTGPYTHKPDEEEDTITLERHDDYWNGPAPIETITYKITPNDTARVEGLLEGRLDLIEHVPVERKDELEKTEGVDVLDAPSTRVIFLGFDFREDDSYAYPDGENPTADKSVRKAIYHAVDEQAIIEDIMGGAAEPASQFLPPHIFGHNPDIKRLPHDEAEAEKLLAEAGYEEGFDITLDCPTDRYVNDEEICRRVAEDLGKVGIDVTVNAQPKKNFFPKVRSRNTSFHLLGWAADTADGAEIFDYLLTTPSKEQGKGNVNLGHYSNPLVDELGARSGTTLDPQKRLAIMQEGFAIAMEDVAWVPLHLQSILYAKDSGLDWEPRADVKIKLEDMAYE